MVQSFKVTTTLAAYRCVSAVTGTGHTVEYPDTATAFLLGITSDTVKDTTGSVPVKGPGEIGLLYFNDTVTSGELVSCDTSGRGVPFAIHTIVTATIPACYIGVLVGASVSETGVTAQVYISPGYGSGTR